METFADNLRNFLNQPVIIQDGLRRHEGVVLGVTERKDGWLDVPLHCTDGLVTIVEMPKNFAVTVMDDM